MTRYVSLFILVILSNEIAAYVEALAANYDSVSQQHSQLFVAMICDDKRTLINQYMNENHQWVSDTDKKSTCIKNKTDILKYCQKVYPNKDVRNIVESTHHYAIENWCRNDGSKCGERHVVRPYRCLEGNFESDALLVPQQCVFDHIHKQAECEDFDYWNGAASRHCYNDNKTLRSFAMLKPCGIGVFSGVEFVCCPKKEEVTNNLDSEKTVPIKEVNIDAENEIDGSSNSKKSVDKSSPEYYFTHFDSEHEHDLFKKAQERLEEIQHDKVSDVMKDWSDLVERYQEMKLKDPKGAEKFRQETTQRFQKTVKALEKEQNAEKAQILSMHQQRVAATINLKKKEGMNCYVDSLNVVPPKPKKVQKCLQKLLRSIEKDRHHTLKHYHHMLEKDVSNDDKMRAEVLDHLDNLNKVYNKSMEMLEKFPVLVKKIQQPIHEFWIDLRDRLQSELPSELIYSVSREDDEIILQYYKHNVQTKIRVKQQRKQIAMKKAEEIHDVEEEKEKVEANVGHKIEKFDPETMEDESIAVKPQSVNVKTVSKEKEIRPLKISHYQHNKINQDEVTFSVKREEVGSYVTLTNNIAVALAFVGVALIVVIIVGVSVLRRKTRRSTPSNQGFIEVDQAATPEERHVANMQVNGYENPTYKYFETQN